MQEIIIPHFPLGIEYSDSMACVTEAPRSFHYAALLTVVSAAVGRKVWMPYGQRLYPNLFTCLVGASGLTRKTTAIRLALGLLPDLPTLKGLSSYEGLLERLRDTPELLVVLDEFSAFLLKVKKQEAISNTLPKLAELYDNPSKMELPTRANPVTVLDPYLSILTATTPEWLENSLQMTDIMGGIGNRFMFVFGVVDTPVDMPAVPEYGELPEKLLATVGKYKRDTRLSLDPEGEDSWKIAYRRWYEEQKAMDEIRRVLDARMPGLSLKVAMLLHVLEGQGTNISWKYVESAIEYVESIRKYLDELRPLFSPLEEKILNTIRREKGIKRWRLHELVGGRVRGRDFHEAVTTLTRYNRILETPDGFIREKGKD